MDESHDAIHDFGMASAILVVAALAALANPVRVKTVDDTVLEGELLEGRYGDDLVIRVPMGDTVRLRWSSLRWIEYDGHKVAARSEGAQKLDLPWAGRLTLAAHAGLVGIFTETFEPYVGGGFVYGASLGWSFDRALSAALLYEHAVLSGGERNGVAPVSPSNAVAVLLRVRSNNASGGGGIFAHLGAGVRWLSYRFAGSDGSETSPLWAPPQPVDQEASLFGIEGRLAIGFAMTFTRAVSAEIYFGSAIGHFVRYTDTLDCNTFKPGPCGGGYSFTYGLHGLFAELSWN